MIKAIIDKLASNPIIFILIRRSDEYANIFNKYFHISEQYPMRSGFYDYQIFICSCAGYGKI